MRRIHFGILVIFWAVLTLGLAPEAGAGEPEDVIAKVGDQVITFSEIDVIINSSSMIGLSIPAYGTPERARLRLNFLDKLISVNLLYLDALKKGMDKVPVYQEDIKHFSDAMLATVYKQKSLIGELPVTDEEVEAYYKQNVVKDEETELTADVRLAIESKIRKQEYKKKTATQRDRLRKGISLSVNKEHLNLDEDSARKGDVAVAAVDGEPVTWGEVKRLLTVGPGKKSSEDRMEALNQFIDERIMVKKAKAAGMEKDPLYHSRTREYRKTRLVNIYREKLVEAYEPTEEEIKKYYEKNRERIFMPESRKVRMVVLKTKKEAKEIKKNIKSGEITIFEAARDHSLDPNAKMTLGEMGWVSEGTGFPELDKLTFSLDPGELGGPVESPAGWHLVQVEDQRDSQYGNIKDKETRKVTLRMIIKEKVDHYVLNLRKNEFPVEFYEDVFNFLSQQEVDRMNEMRKAIDEPASPDESAR